MLNAHCSLHTLPRCDGPFLFPSHIYIEDVLPIFIIAAMLGWQDTGRVVPHCQQILTKGESARPGRAAQQ